VMSQDIGDTLKPNSALVGFADASGLVIQGWVKD
jgi:hypothetical protein